MPKTRDRLPEILDAATQVFSRNGYRRTQMADVAREMGVSPGTLYRYVESKDAMFDLVVRHGLEATEGPDLPKERPVAAPPPNATIAYLKDVLERQDRWPRLTAALACEHPTDVRTEFEGIINELYDLMKRNRWGLRVLSRSALDWPELALVFLAGLRRELLHDLSTYLDRRAAAGHLRPIDDAYYAAAFISESLAMWVFHRFGDPGFSTWPEDKVRTAVLEALVHAYAKDPCHEP